MYGYYREKLLVNHMLVTCFHFIYFFRGSFKDQQALTSSPPPQNQATLWTFELVKISFSYSCPPPPSPVPKLRSNAPQRQYEQFFVWSKTTEEGSANDNKSPQLSLLFLIITLPPCTTPSHWLLITLISRLNILLILCYDMLCSSNVWLILPPHYLQPAVVYGCAISFCTISTHSMA